MIKSMTGFGKGEYEKDGIYASVELKSVNHRYFEFNCRAPRAYQFLEEKLKSFVFGKVSRGKIDAFVTLRLGDAEKVEISVNHSYAEPYFKALRDLKNTYSLDGEITVDSVVSNPEIFTVTNEQADETLVWEYVKNAAESALEMFVDMRKKEGQKLASDVRTKIDNILGSVEFIENESPNTVKAYRERIELKMRELLQDKQIDEQRLLTETAVFADKTAVDEETVRLRSHMSQVLEMLESAEPVGRKLDFIVQEMNREANTIGSKSQNLQIARAVVDIKSEIEKIREQIQNIE